MSVPVSQKKRILYSLLGIGAIFLLLIIRLFWLQIIEGEELQEKALKQWTRDTALTAARGKIMDANGIVLAQSGTAYKVLLWPQSVPAAERERVAKELAKLLDLDEADVLEKINDKKHSEIVLKRQVDRETVDMISLLKLNKGVVTAIDTKRYYPEGTLLSQTLGFTNIDGAGQMGLEQNLNKYLVGEDGRMITETDLKGRTLAYGVQEYIQPLDGYDVVLTVDSVVQSILEKKLKEALEVNRGSKALGIVMNAKTGQIVALSTQPDYDPNNPPRSDMNLLNDLSKNRLVTDAYEPGSTFKIITLAAALDSNAASLEDTVDCPGYYMLGSEKINCWKPGGHGHQTLTRAVENSCNPAFIRMALSMQKEEFYDYIYSFGFGAQTNCGLQGEGAGIVTHEKYIRDADLARIGFGQSIAMTPMQLITAVSAAVNGGNLMQPYIVERIVSQTGETVVQNQPMVVRRVISEETSATLREILVSVVENGSGRNAQINGYKVGGKTGTAQKYENGIIAEGKLVASFIAFAPADDPEYVCLIIVDEPKVGVIFGSTVAAPAVKDVLEETLRYYRFMPESQKETVRVPKVTGMTTQEAKTELERVGLKAMFQDSGTVMVQVPQEGENAIKGTDVLLYTDLTDVVTSGDSQVAPVKVTVPDLKGLTRLQANDKLRKLGLSMVIDETDNIGNAYEQSPAAGLSVDKGTEITVKFKIPEA